MDRLGISTGTMIKALEITHYTYPFALLALFGVVLTVNSILTSEEAGPARGSRRGLGQPAKKKGWTRKIFTHTSSFTPLQNHVFQWLLVLLIITFLANAANVIIHALAHRGWWCGQAYVVYNISAVFLFACILLSLLDTRAPPNISHLSALIISLLLEITLLAESAVYFRTRTKQGIETPKKALRKLSKWQSLELAIDAFRVVTLTITILFYLGVAIAHRRPEESLSETTSLLNGTPTDVGSSANSVHANGNGNGHAQGYGTADDATPAKKKEAGWERPAKVQPRSWWQYLKGYSRLFPYLWPEKDRKLQLVIVICIGLVLIQRVLNVLVPRQLGIVTNLLTGEDGHPPYLPWFQILVYIVFRLLTGTGGLVGAVRAALWIPVGQFSYRELSKTGFEHVHGLSLDFHLGKKTGEVLSALSKGSSINNFLEQVTFQVVPMIIDLTVAVIYFLVAFDAYYALVVSIMSICYLYITVKMAQWRADIRREMVNADREESAVKTDSMMAYETVKYFNAENYEFTRYQTAVDNYQRAEYQVLWSLNLMNVAQNTVFTCGLLITCFLMAYEVSAGKRKVGDFVVIITYMAVLQQPLNFFGTFYRMIQSAMINSERFLELLAEQPTVIDAPHAEVLDKCNGEIVFDDIHFRYDSRKPALDGLSFTAAPGTTTALVGESGGGKSTVFRLLFRFYNAKSGSLTVDGHNVLDVTIDSFRSHIGVVPQDTVLFNETLMYNLKYANPDVTDEEVYEACRSASIHDHIMDFPDGYNTKVGERGLRLSGGEKQRVAIARTILKKPKIILLDEATAALDSGTEEHIQKALEELARGRTTLIIAHRLSTITNADQILVLHGGRVAERGTHEELLALDGQYAEMWQKQIRAEKATKEIKDMKMDGLLAARATGPMRDPRRDMSSVSLADHGHGHPHH